MAISRAQLVKELEPGLNALFGLEYKQYGEQWTEIFDTESSDRAFEEEVMLAGFANAAVKAEGQGVQFDQAQETFTARYTNETIALAFAITEEAIEDNLYDRLASRYTKALARSMASTKNIKGAAVLNNAFDSNFAGGDGKELCAADHPTLAGDFSNELATAAELNETSLEQSLIDIAAFTDERGLKIAAQGVKLIIPSTLFCLWAIAASSSLIFVMTSFTLSSILTISRVYLLLSRCSCSHFNSKDLFCLYRSCIISNLLIGYSVYLGEHSRSFPHNIIFS